jgi:hypothetical protein
MRSSVNYVRRSIYDLDHKVESYDVVLCLGVLYHLKHPLLGLERLCAVTKDTAYIETYTIDGPDQLEQRPRMEFYEKSELRGQFDNWVGPNIVCVMALLRAAGFACVAYKGSLGERAHFSAARRVPVLSQPLANLHVRAVENAIDASKEFYYNQDPYLAIWIVSETELSVEALAVRIGGYDSLPVSCAARSNGLYQLITKVPPGLLPGFYPLTMLMGGVTASNVTMIAVDVDPSEQRECIFDEPPSGLINNVILVDGITGRSEVSLSMNSVLTIWFSSIGHFAFRDFSVRLNGVDLTVEYLDLVPGVSRQANCRLPRKLRHGEYSVEIRVAEKLCWRGSVRVG